MSNAYQCPIEDHDSHQLVSLDWLYRPRKSIQTTSPCDDPRHLAAGLLHTWRRRPPFAKADFLGNQFGSTLALKNYQLAPRRELSSGPMWNHILNHIIPQNCTRSRFTFRSAGIPRALPEGLRWYPLTPLAGLQLHACKFRNHGPHVIAPPNNSTAPDTDAPPQARSVALPKASSQAWAGSLRLVSTRLRPAWV